jgi:nicotinate-nucleotide pyrophosphorylase (carboxylating)
MGGGENHRFALWDMYLVKDNHIRAAGGLTAAIDRIQRTRQDVPLEVEVESLAQLQEALRPEVDRILVDNRSVEEVKNAVVEVDRWFKANPPEARAMRKGAKRWPEVEVSGGLTLETIRAYAQTGADYLSVGGLTHSAPALNLSLEIEEVG